jgi:hypothetical protein
VPRFIGRRAFRNYDLAEIARYIDWQPFFQTWDLHGRFPDILNDPVVGESARRVFSDGKAMLRRVIDGRWIRANAVIAFLPANAVDEDRTAVGANLDLEANLTEKLLGSVAIRAEDDSDFGSSFSGKIAGRYEVIEGLALRGAFSLRSPVRPNPIATQLVDLLRVEGTTLVVRGLDCVDGTPLLDLKPDSCAYSPPPRRP